jgi:hypothetical protein
MRKQATILMQKSSIYLIIFKYSVTIPTDLLGKCEAASLLRMDGQITPAVIGHLDEFYIYFGFIAFFQG